MQLSRPVTAPLYLVILPELIPFFCGFLEDDSCVFSLLGVDSLKKLFFCLENDSE